MSPPLRLAFSIFALVIPVGSPPAFAGELDDFERSATEDNHDDDGDDGNDDVYVDDDSGDALATAALIALSIPIAGAVQSFDRVCPEAASSPFYTLEPRRWGEAVIAFARVDAAYQLVKSDVDAWDLRGELGFGPFAIQARETHYDEDQPRDDLELIQAHALLRMTVIEEIEIDLGIGGLVIDGADTVSGVSGTIPILFHPWDFIGLEFRPSWASVNDNIVSDYDVSLLAGWRFISVRAGYRWTDSGHSSLNGPIFGLAARW